MSTLGPLQPSAISASQPGQAPYLCPSCSRVFSRSEHLDRHRRSHDQQQSKSFLCRVCAKGFTRKDVLTRHVRAVHETPSVPRRSRKKSCVRCANFKIRCSGGDTCDACAKRSLQCVYEFRRVPGVTGTPSTEKDDDNCCSPTADDKKPVSETSSVSSPRTKFEQEGFVAKSSVQAPLLQHNDMPALSEHSSSELHHIDVKAHEQPQLYVSANTNASSNARQSFTPGNGGHQLRTNDVFPLPPLPPPETEAAPTSIPSPLGNVMSNDNLENWLFDPGAFELDWLRAELGVTDLYAGRLASACNNSIGASSVPTQAPSITPSGSAMSDRSSGDASTGSSLPTPPMSTPSQANTPPYAKTFYYEKSRQPSQLVVQQQPTGSFQQTLPPLQDSQLASVSVLSPISPQPYYISTTEAASPATLGTSSTAPTQPSQSFTGKYRPSLAPPTWLGDSQPALAPPAASLRSSSKPVASPMSLSLPAPVPFSSLVTRRQQEQDPERQQSDLWPWTPRSLTSREENSVKLPPLRKILEQTATLNIMSGSQPLGYEGIDEHCRSEIISLLEVPYGRHPYAEVDISKFPDWRTLDTFLHLYFEHFHPILPMIHRPTFRTPTCPSILLATMLSVGASYADMEGSHQFADTLSELCKRTLLWLGNYDSTYTRSGYFVMAFLLQNIHALGSGDKRLYEEADASRSYLVSNARSMGLFSPPPKETVFSVRGDESAEQLERLWHAWRDEEMGKRLAWSVFEYDSSISTLSSRRGCMALNDLCNDMPCDERLWEAPTAREWAAYAFPPGQNTLARGLPFYRTLRDLIAGAISPDVVPNWGKRLCAQAIGRILWDFRELEDSALSRILPDPPTDYSQSKETLLRALIYLHDSMTDPYNILDMVHMNMTCLIAHYSHLYTAREIMDLVIALARQRKADRLDAMHRIQVIFTLDPVHSRKLAWHAAQIIGIARRYPIRTPCETMRVFLAGLFLYAFAKYFPPPGVQAGAPIVKLDTLSWLNKYPQTQQTKTDDLEKWFLDGGRASMDYVEDIHAQVRVGQTGASGAENVLAVVLATLRSMKSWGVAAKFCNVLIYVHRRDATE
ncbi:fungal-specific transcription factor domain-containing protein [Lipomyces kononenkoae]|uniref:Fungal-specific transcription factor domain-containing protein n=1 Tax=Lipomyces kononenkoae TaxID=34357 RepID=A0ACC3T8N3_LIPKO